MIHKRSRILNFYVKISKPSCILYYDASRIKKTLFSLMDSSFQLCFPYKVRFSVSFFTHWAATYNIYISSIALNFALLIIYSALCCSGFSHSMLQETVNSLHGCGMFYHGYSKCVWLEDG